MRIESVPAKMAARADPEAPVVFVADFEKALEADHKEKFAEILEQTQAVLMILSSVGIERQSVPNGILQLISNHRTELEGMKQDLAAAKALAARMTVKADTLNEKIQAQTKIIDDLEKS